MWFLIFGALEVRLLISEEIVIVIIILDKLDSILLHFDFYLPKVSIVRYWNIIDHFEFPAVGFLALNDNL